MFTRNYDSLFYGLKMITTGYASDIPTQNVQLPYFVDSNGTHSTVVPGNAIGYYKSGYYTEYQNPLAPKAWIIKIGSGVTVPNKNDITIENDITNLFSSFAYTYNIYVNEKYETVTSYTITGLNNSQSSLTINEIGVYHHTQPGENNDKYHLLIRDLLPEPLEVPSGQSFRIIYEIVENVTT